MRLLLLFLLLSLYCSHSFATHTGGDTAPHAPAVYDQKVEARMIVSSFLEQVDEGTVSLFGAALSRDMLEPVKVSREYQFADDNTTIMIYSRLTEPMPLPEAKQYTIVGISVYITSIGEIQEIKAHLQGH